MGHLIKKAAEAIAGGKRITALTGAGISVESGIPPFRGKGGIWERFDPMEYASIDAFLKDPEKVWRVLILEMIRTLRQAVPNKGHLGLAQLERLGKLSTVITQNVDGLHQKAGSKDVIEFHGSFATFHCLACEQKVAMDQLDLIVLPPRCSCGGIIRPDIVFFGELIPPEALERAHLIATTCDVMLVVGTSAMVQPAADLPLLAKRNGAVIIEINPEETPLTRVSDIFLEGKAGKILEQIVSKVPHPS